VLSGDVAKKMEGRGGSWWQSPGEGKLRTWNSSLVKAKFRQKGETALENDKVDANGSSE
jgi:hypothetical protein